MNNTDDTFTENRQIIKWFSRQAQSVQADILGQAFAIAGTQAFDTLVDAVRTNGYRDEKAYKTSHTISENAARKMYDRRKAQGLERLSHKKKVNMWLKVNFIKLKDLRETGLSWRGISILISDEYKISISHTTLSKFWRNNNFPSLLPAQGGYKLHKLIEIKIYTKEAHDFIHMIFKIDKLFLQLSASEMSQFVSNQDLLNVYKLWIERIVEMEIFCEYIITNVDCLQIGDNYYTDYAFDIVDISKIYGMAQSLQKEKGRTYQVTVTSYITRQLLIVCRRLDICFTFLQILLNASSEFKKEADYVNQYYHDTLKGFTDQYNQDSKILSDALAKKENRQDQEYSK
jgi:hypothetical protein